MEYLSQETLVWEHVVFFRIVGVEGTFLVIDTELLALQKCRDEGDNFQNVFIQISDNTQGAVFEAFSSL